jgi:hypothetical protein
MKSAKEIFNWDHTNKIFNSFDASVILDIGEQDDYSLFILVLEICCYSNNNGDYIIHRQEVLFCKGLDYIWAEFLITG